MIEKLMPVGARRLVRLSSFSYQGRRSVDELKLHLPNVSFELRERILRILDSPLELFRLESGPAAVGADLTVFLEPSDRLLDLLAACRAVDLHV